MSLFHASGKMSVRYLTFDCYGTLIDWRMGLETNFRSCARLDNSADVDIFKRYQEIEASKEQGYSSYKEILESSFMELAHQLDLDPSKEDAKGFSESIKSWPPFEDTVSTLRSLGMKGYKRVILSNVDKDLLRGTIGQSGLDVDGYITAEDVKSYKPKETHWIRFLEQYGLEKDEVIHVAGSIYHDIAPASSLGFKTIWVNRYREPNEGNVLPNYEVENLSAILDALENQEK